MSIKTFGAKIFAKKVYNKIQKWAKKPVKTQEKVFQKLISNAQHTQFGTDHNFSAIKTHDDYVKHVPVRDYEGLRTYVDQVVEGKENVLWKGKPLYFAKTSGTTSGVKNIPLTQESLKYHVQAARDAILCYVHETGNSKFVKGKMIFLQGSP